MNNWFVEWFSHWPYGIWYGVLAIIGAISVVVGILTVMGKKNKERKLVTAIWFVSAILVGSIIYGLRERFSLEDWCQFVIGVFLLGGFLFVVFMLIIGAFVELKKFIDALRNASDNRLVGKDDEKN